MFMFHVEHKINKKINVNLITLSEIPIQFKTINIKKGIYINYRNEYLKANKKNIIIIHKVVDTYLCST